MARPRIERDQPQGQLNVRLAEDLRRAFFSAFPEIGFSSKQDAAGFGAALVVEFRDEMSRFLGTHSDLDSKSSRQLAAAFKRWLNQCIHESSQQTATPASADKTSKTSFNFPDELLAEFKAASRGANQNQTALAIEAFRDVIAKKRGDIPETEPPSAGENTTSELKIKIDAIRRMCDEMAALLTPGDQIVKNNSDVVPQQSEHEVIIGTFAGPGAKPRGSDDGIAEALERADADYDRSRANSAATRRELDDIRRNLTTEEEGRSETGRSRQKAG